MSVTGSSPHIHCGNSVQAMMFKVLLAMLPGIMIHSFYYGCGLLIQIILTTGTALICEAVMLRLYGAPIKNNLMNGSAIVTAVLLAITISPLSPWWLAIVASAFAIIVIKQLYGGLGCNLFNPAMAGYVFVLLSFPAQFTNWPTIGNVPDFANTLAIIFKGNNTIDGISGATPLNHMKLQVDQMVMISEIRQHQMFGSLGESGRELVNIGFLIGGLILVFLRVIDWKIPAMLLGMLFISSTVGYISNSDGHPSPLFYIFGGSSILCAFFIATDPTSGTDTPKGRLLFAAGCGLLIYLLRTHASMPDSTAFAVLLMNCLAPTIDHYNKPKLP